MTIHCMLLYIELLLSSVKKLFTFEKHFLDKRIIEMKEKDVPLFLKQLLIDKYPYKTLSNIA